MIFEVRLYMLDFTQIELSFALLLVPLLKSLLLFGFYRAITFNIGTITDPPGRFQPILRIGQNMLQQKQG